MQILDMKDVLDLSTQIRQVFDDGATATADYSRRFQGPVGAFFLETQAELLRELTAPWPQGSVLDVGGGHGQVTEALDLTTRPVTVASSLRAGQTQVAHLVEAGRISFVRCNLQALPFPDRSFDVVVSIRMIAHVEDWPGYLAELARVARHAVIVDFSEKHSVNALSTVFFGMKKAIEKNTRKFRTHRNAEIVDVLGGCGFDAPLARPQFVLPMALHRAMGRVTWSRAAEDVLKTVGLQRFGSPVMLRMSRPEQGRAPKLVPRAV